MTVTFTAETTLPLISDRLLTIETEAKRCTFLATSIESLVFFPETNQLYVMMKNGQEHFFNGKVASEVESHLRNTIKQLHGIA